MKTTLSTTAITNIFFVASTSAQQNYTINPSSVPLSTRDVWCESQVSQCPLICADTTRSLTCQSNTCAATSLAYSCICSNGASPNLSQYSLTLPYYICQEWGNQCVANCGEHNNACAAACRADHPCGALHPKLAATKTTTSGVHSTTAKSTQTANTGFAHGDTSGANPAAMSYLLPVAPGEMGKVLMWVGFIFAVLLGSAIGI